MPTNTASARIFVSLCLSAVARRHRAAAAFSHDYADVAVSIEPADDLDELSTADPANLPDLLVILDGNVPVRLPAGSHEHTIATTLKREWSAAIAVPSTIGGAA